MRTHSYFMSYFAALLLLSFAVGCGDPDKNANAGKPGDPLTPPSVTLVTPPDGNVATCPNSATVSAAFSKAMNPATLNTSTFTVTGPGNICCHLYTYGASCSKHRVYRHDHYRGG